MHFRGSSVGYCTRKLVLGHLQPELTSIPDERRPFLDAGHNLQDAAEAFIEKRLPADWTLMKLYREAETFTRAEEWTSKGHVDGVLQGPTGVWLLEVKAVMDKNFKKIEKSLDWREPYASYGYEDQAQMYLHTEALAPTKGQNLFTPDLAGTIFLFYNRNTSEMMGGVDIDHEAWTYRPDMIEYKDDEKFARLSDKLDRASNYIMQEEAPDDCDADAYCFFCGIRGAGARRDTTKRVFISERDGDTEEAAAVEAAIAQWDAGRRGMASLFASLSADVITLDGETVITLEKRKYE